MPPKALTPMTPEVGVTATIIDNGLEGTTFNPVDPDEVRTYKITHFRLHSLRHPKHG